MIKHFEIALILSILFPLILCKLSEDEYGDGAKILGDLAGLFGDGIGGNDCFYSCPNGLRPIPKKNYKAKSNGCGAYGIQIQISPAVTKCCDKHDICYGTCNKKRTKCDKDFKRCIEEVCENGSNKLRSSCLMNSQLLYGGAMALGCQAFLESQKDACVCSRNIDEV